MAEELIYSFAWREWNEEGRLALLREMNIEYHFSEEKGYIQLIGLGLSGSQREAFEFLRDPIHPIKFHIFDYAWGRKLLQMHYDFWHYYFYPKQKV